MDLKATVALGLIVTIMVAWIGFMADLQFRQTDVLDKQNERQQLIAQQVAALAENQKNTAVILREIQERMLQGRVAGIGKSDALEERIQRLEALHQKR